MGADNSINNTATIFFDGVCNLCNASVQFIIKRDHSRKFRFASLQSDFAKKTLPEAYLSSEKPPTLVLMDQGFKVKSTAALTIAKNLSGLWPILYVFIIIPPFIRHFVYDLIAKNRYRMFGKRDECMLPSPEVKDLFVD